MLVGDLSKGGEDMQGSPRFCQWDLACKNGIWSFSSYAWGKWRGDELTQGEFWVRRKDEKKSEHH